MSRKLKKSCPYLTALSHGEFLAELNRLAFDQDDEIALGYLMTSYERKKIVKLCENRLVCLFAIIQQLPLEKRILVFCEQIDQVNEVCRAMRRERLVLSYHSKQDTTLRKRVLDEFRNQDGAVLVSCKALDEGMDVPDASICLVFAGTGEQRQRIQRLSRVLRKQQGKNAAYLYYPYVKTPAKKPLI